MPPEKLFSSDCTLLCGIDEAGRGPLAGPVCAGAVILGPDFPGDVLLLDSKKLSLSGRARAEESIYRRAYAWGLGWASPEEIDAINILRASLLAMERAFLCLKNAMPYYGAMAISCIIDGLHVPALPCPARALVKADQKIPEVMAASILAKTARDRLMEYYDLFIPGYDYGKHKGYPTKAHKEAIARLGPSEIQRKSFRW